MAAVIPLGRQQLDGGVGGHRIAPSTCCPREVLSLRRTLEPGRTERLARVAYSGRCCYRLAFPPSSLDLAAFDELVNGRPRRPAAGRSIPRQQGTCGRRLSSGRDPCSGCEPRREAAGVFGPSEPFSCGN
jgi:hypothetical protein